MNILPILSTNCWKVPTDSGYDKSKRGVRICGSIGACSLSDTANFCYSDFYVGTYNEMANYYTPELTDSFSKRLFIKAKWRTEKGANRYVSFPKNSTF